MQIANNIIAHTASTSGWGIMLESGTTKVGVNGNILFSWRAPLISDQGTANVVDATNVLDAGGSNSGSSPEPFSDPTRSVGSYYGTLGGTATLNSFLAAARAQSKGAWNTQLMASAVNSYIQAGFGITSSPTTQSSGPSGSSVSDTTAPSTPAGLAATAISGTQVNLSWTAATDNVGVTGYKVFRNGIQVGTTANTSYQDAGLAGGTTYSYTVAAYDAAGNTSAQSTAVSITTPVPPSVSVTISSPTNGATIKGNGTVNIAVSATDSTSVASLTIMADGNTLATCLNANSCSATWLGKKISQGTHTITGAAIDNQGNNGKSSVLITALK